MGHAAPRRPRGFELLLDAARGGEGAAFEEIYARFRPAVHTFARARRSADPEAVVNDVFLAVFRNLHGFTGDEDAFRAWIFRIARNRLIDEARHAARRVAAVHTAPGDLADTAVPPGGGDADVEVEVLGRLGSAWVEEQLGRLTPDQRDVVLLRVLGDLSLEGTARVLGKPLTAVKSLQKRAFRTLAGNISREAVSE